MSSDRREFIGALAVGFLSLHPAIRPSAQSQDSILPAGRLYDPLRAGRPVAPVTDADNLEAVKAVERRLKCTCGCTLDVYTCRTTDFNCGVSPVMHRQVLALMNEGKSGEEIVAEFVAQNGEQILMAPPKRGFNLAGYFLPGLALVTTGALLVLAMRRWTRRAAVVAARAVPESPGAAQAHSAEDLERLEHELSQLEE